MTLNDLLSALAAADTSAARATNELISWIGAGLGLILLGRVLHDRSFRYLAATLVLFAGNRFLSSLSDQPDILVLAGNLLSIGSALCEICFFRTVLNKAVATRPPRLHKEVLLATIVAIVATTTWLLAPSEAQGGELASIEYADDPAAFIFVTVIIGYYITVTFRVVNWTRQLLSAWARSPETGRVTTHTVSRRFTPGRIGFQIGVIIIGLGESLRFFADVFKLGSHVAVLISPPLISVIQLLSPIVQTGVRTGRTAFYVGALLPLLAGAAHAVVTATQQAHNFRIVGPLWHAVTGEFPDLAFRGLRGISGRFYRREIEIRDGLLLLEPYYDPDLAIQAKHGVPDGTDRDVIVAIALIRGAIGAHRANQPVPNPHPTPTSGASNRADDLAWMLRVAAGFASAERDKAPLLRAAS